MFVGRRMDFEGQARPGNERDQSRDEGESRDPGSPSAIGLYVVHEVTLPLVLRMRSPRSRMIIEATKKGTERASMTSSTSA
jgi:hypothetical protein